MLRNFGAKLNMFIDFASGWRKREIAFIFGWQDIAQRYRRSKVGAFWLTINMAVLIAALGTIFGALFRMPMDEFLPYLAAGLIFWGFISTTITEGCMGFISSEGIILQVRMPFFTHILRIWWRNTIIVAHNLVIFPFILLVFMKPPSWTFVLLPVGFVLVSLNVLWMSYLLATVCARFRDLPLVVQNLLQVLFYATPLMWTPQTLPEGPIQAILALNPFYHLISILRDPLLGTVPSIESWVVAVVMAVFGWICTIVVFERYQWRIAYWL